MSQKVELRAVDPEPQGVQLPRSEFRKIVESLVDGVMIIDQRGVIQRANQAIEVILGFPEAELLGQNVSVIMTGKDREQHDRHLASYQKTGRAQIIGIGREVETRHKDGTMIPIELAVTPALTDLLDVTESEYGFIGEIRHRNELPYLKTRAITNIARNHETRKFYRENAAKGLEFTNLDTLFGISIRSGQRVISNEPMDDHRRGGLPKGHPPLKAYLGLPIYSGSKLVGYGGEEFLFGLPDCSVADAQVVVERMRSRAEQSPFELADGQQLPLSVSIGVAGSPNGWEDLSELIREGDQSRYAAKRNGRNCVFGQ